MPHLRPAGGLQVKQTRRGVTYLYRNVSAIESACEEHVQKFAAQPDAHVAAHWATQLAG